jgi:acetylornithine deacetylase/succinyl-diaminopimelate desuccinylase-like protein
VSKLAEAVARLGRYEWPVRITSTVGAFLDAASEAYGVDLDPADPKLLFRTLGTISKIIVATTRNTTNPTMLRAGYKHNVIPGRAEAYVDGRFLPGHRAEFLATLDEVLGPQVRREAMVSDVAVETEFASDLVDAMRIAICAEDPRAQLVPYCMSGGTDAKAFSGLGIRGFGFAPLQLPPELDFAGMFHGVDERVPIDGLQFGARVLDRFLDLV